MIKRILLLISLFNLLFFQGITKEKGKEEENDERELVRILLEDDTPFFRQLIPVIDSLSYTEFKKLFYGDYKYEYNSDDRFLLKRLALKFKNFFFILSEWAYKKDHYKYLKQIWNKYPNLDNLSKLQNEKDISEKLKYILPDYINWPENIKNELIEIIKYPADYAEEIMKEIKEENFEVDQILTKLINGIKKFEIPSYEEFIKENQFMNYESLLNGIFKILNKPTETIKDPKKVYEMVRSIPSEFSKLSPFCKENFNLISLNILQQTIKRNTVVNNLNSTYIEAIENIVLDLYNSKNEKGNSGNENNNLQDIKENVEKGKSKWPLYLGESINIAINLYETCIIGYDTFSAIKTLNNLLSENVFKTRLKKISEDFNEHQISKFLSNNPKYNLQLIKESYNNIKKDQEEILKLISDIKRDIIEKNDKKKYSIKNLAFKGINVFMSIFDYIITDNPIMKTFDIVNSVFGGINMVLYGVDIYYLDKIIIENEIILKDTYELQHKIKEEIDSIFEECKKIKNIYPRDYTDL